MKLNILTLSRHDLSALIAGVGGGAVALIRAAKHRKEPIKLRYIFGSLFVAAFAAWLVSLLLPHHINGDIRTAICGIAGMTGDKVLSILENNWLEYIEYRTGGRRHYDD